MTIPMKQGDVSTSVWPESVQRVAQALQVVQPAAVPQMLEVETRTAQEAADHLEVALGQIAKSVVFKRSADAAPVLVVTAGDRRVDVQKVASLLGAIERANAAFVKEQTGFVIGGVAPVGHLVPPMCLLDESLKRFDCVWAAAGHPRSLVPMSPQMLEAVTGAPWADVIEELHA